MLQISLFGRPKANFNGKPVSGFISDKALGLLCYLAVNEGAHAREKLADLLWGAFPPGRARANLRQALSNLQKLVPGYFEVTRKTAAFLHDQPHWVDVVEFLALAADSDQSGPEGQTEEPHQDTIDLGNAEKAAALYQDEFLSDLFVDGAPEFEAWVGMERERLRLLLLRTLRWLGTQYQDRRDFDAAAEALHRVLSIEPWHEDAHRRLMLLYARLGQFEAALTQFEQCRQILADELNVEPRPDTISLYERIRAARRITPKPLPPQPTPFVDRRTELDTLQELLLKDDVHLVTISGLGGVGKTRLALAAAEVLRPYFLEGIIYVSLNEITEAEALFSALARALGISLKGKPEPVQQIVSYLQDKETMLILDNAEGIVEDASALESILTGAPQVKMLVTSRMHLNLRWEQPFLLSGLPLGETGTALHSPAGELFLQTAQRVSPTFMADQAEVEVIHQICQKVEGLPLGLELAASWLRSLPLAQIAEEMKHDEAFLATSQFRGSERETSLWATFTYSWRMLSAEERAVFKKLSVFRGGFDRRAAQSVTETSLLTLSALVEMSMLRVVGRDRYQIHEQLRQFAEEKLATSEVDWLETHTSHSRTYLQRLARHESKLKRSGVEEAADILLIDWDNIRTAWSWAVAQRDFSLLEQSSAALYELCNLRQLYRQGKELFSQAATAVRGQPGLDPLLARLQLALGALHFFLGQIEESLRLFSVSERTLRQADLKHEWALNLMWRGFAISNTGFGGDLSEGEELLRQSLALFEELDDTYYQARCLGNLGNNLASRGDHEQAWQQWQQSLDLFEELGIEWGQAGTLVSMGKAALQLNQRQKEALHYMERGLAMARQADHKQIIFVALGGLATAAEIEGDLQAAEKYIQEALDYAQALGHRSAVADQLNHLGRVSVRLGQIERAKGYLQRSLNLIEQYGYRAKLGSVLTNLGLLEKNKENYSQAGRYFGEAIEVAQELEQAGTVLEALGEIAEMEFQQGIGSERLPELIIYLVAHPLASPAIRERMMTIAEIAAIDLSAASEAKSSALALVDMIKIVQEEFLLEQDNRD